MIYFILLHILARVGSFESFCSMRWCQEVGILIRGHGRKARAPAKKYSHKNQGVSRGTKTRLAEILEVIKFRHPRDFMELSRSSDIG